MGKDEKEFYIRKAKIAKFKKELKELMTKYAFGQYESNNYDGKEEYCGSNYYFVVDGETWYGETIDEIIEECSIVKWVK